MTSDKQTNALVDDSGRIVADSEIGISYGARTSDGLALTWQGARIRQRTPLPRRRAGLLLGFFVAGVGFHLHVHSGPYVVGGLGVGVDMRHPSEDHRNPKSVRLFACLFGVDTPLRAKLRMRPGLLFERQVAWSAAEVHMTVPGRDAERS